MHNEVPTSHEWSAQQRKHDAPERDHLEVEPPMVAPLRGASGKSLVRKRGEADGDGVLEPE